MSLLILYIFPAESKIILNDDKNLKAISVWFVLRYTYTCDTFSSSRSALVFNTVFDTNSFNASTICFWTLTLIAIWNAFSIYKCTMVLYTITFVTLWYTPSFYAMSVFLQALDFLAKRHTRSIHTFSVFLRTRVVTAVRYAFVTMQVAYPPCLALQIFPQH